MPTGRKLLKLARYEIENDPHHHLSLPTRQQILNGFGYSDLEHGTNLDGYHKRVELAIASVKKVADLWSKKWPADNTVADVLQKVEHVSHNRQAIDVAATQREIETLWQSVTELVDNTRCVEGISGIASVAAYSVALADIYVDPADIADLVDGDDFMLHDVHFYASAAFAGGPPYSIALAKNSDDKKRGEFWNWWLNKAEGLA